MSRVTWFTHFGGKWKIWGTGSGQQPARLSYEHEGGEVLGSPWSGGRLPEPLRSRAHPAGLRLPASPRPRTQTRTLAARDTLASPPPSGLCFLLLHGTAAGRGTQACWPASSEPTAGGVESWTGRAQGPRPAPCQRSPGQRRHCTGRQSPRSPGLELSAVTAPTRLWALPRLKCKHTEAELLESVLTNYLIKRS